MALRLITGPANAGKTGQLLRALEPAARMGAAVLLYPSHADVARASEELARRMPLGLRVDTLSGWIEGIWAHRGDGRRPVPETVRQLLVGEAAQRCAARVGDSARTDGFTRMLAGLVRRYGACGWPTSHAIGQSLEEYRLSLDGRGLVETADLTKTLADSETIKGLTIGFNLFTDFSAEEESLILALSAANDVIVALTWQIGFAPTEALDGFVSRATARGASVEVLSDVDGGEIGRLHAGMFARRVQPLVPTGAVSLLEAVGPEAEAALVAQCARDLIAGGIPAERCAVVFPELASKRWLLQQAFAAAGVLVEIDVAMPFRTSSFGRSFCSLIRVACGRGGRSELLAFLLSPYSGLDPWVVQQRDAEWRRKRTTDAHQVMRRAAEMYAGRNNPIALAARCAAQGVSQSSGKNWQTLATCLMDNAQSGTRRTAGDVRLDARAYAAVLTGVFEVADEGAACLSAGEYIDALGRVNVSTGTKERIGHVQVTEIHRLRSRRFDALVIAGMTAAEMSAVDEGGLADALAIEMGRAVDGDPALRRRHAFYSVVSRARTRLVLVRQSANPKGDPLGASTFWDEVRDAYRTAEDILNERPSALQVVRTLSLDDLEEATPAFRVGRLSARARARRHAAALRAPRVRTMSLDGLLGDDEVAVTEIEAYLQCPYKWFYERIVRPRGLDTEFGAAEKGSLAHALLRSLYAELAALGLERVTPDNLTNALETLERVAQTMSGEWSHRVQGVRERIAYDSAVDWVRSTLVSDAQRLIGFAPVAHEWRFGHRDERPFDMGGVKLRGSIDRLDSGPKGLVVTDYKSGRRQYGFEEYAKRGLIQTVVYAAAASRLLDAPVVGGLYRSLSSGQIRGFWNVGAAEPEEWLDHKDVVDGAQLAALTAEVTQKVGAAREGMCAGHIEANPLTTEACTWCAAQGLCERTV